MKNLKFLSLIILAVGVLYSCAKYDEGSNFSLLSAKARLVNTWTLTKYEVNGSDQTANSAALEMVFNKNNTFKRTFTLFISISDAGTWAFTDNKSEVVLTKDDGALEKYEIIQLKNKSLKVKRMDNSGTYVYTFKGN